MLAHLDHRLEADARSFLTTILVITEPNESYWITYLVDSKLALTDRIDWQKSFVHLVIVSKPASKCNLDC